MLIIFYGHILSPVVGLLINVISQLLSCRYAKKPGVLKSIFIGFVCGFVVVLTIEAAYYFSTKLTLVESISQLTLSTITYVALGYCFFHFINLGETARRVRIVREIWESKKGLSMDELVERYNASEIINVRLQRMISNRQILHRDGRYYIGKPTILFIAKAIVIMKLILLNKRSEFS